MTAAAMDFEVALKGCKVFVTPRRFHRRMGLPLVTNR
jgi:hypothetical protein